MRKSIFLFTAAAVFMFSTAFFMSKSKSKLPKDFREKFKFVEAGKLKTSTSESDVPAFFIQAAEVSNEEYLAFVNDIKSTGDQSLLRKILPDPKGWSKMPGDMKLFDELYFNHEAYRNYPVVNISHEAAQEYCKWLTKKKMNEWSADGYVANFRLPERTEWLLAAQNGQPLGVYSWGGPSIKNSQGCSLCNYREIGDQAITFDEASGKYIVKTDVPVGLANKGCYTLATAPVDSYILTEFGLFNINGNAAEMTSTPGEAVGGSWNSPGYDVRNESVMNYEGTSAMVGFRPIVTFMKQPSI